MPAPHRDQGFLADGTRRFGREQLCIGADGLPLFRSGNAIR